MLKVSGPLTSNPVNLHGQSSVITLGAQGATAHLTLNFVSNDCKTYQELLEVTPIDVSDLLIWIVSYSHNGTVVLKCA
jgi:hypothetical protein